MGAVMVDGSYFAWRRICLVALLLLSLTTPRIDAAACQSCVVTSLPFLHVRHGRRNSVRSFLMATKSSTGHSLPFLGLVSGHQLVETWSKRLRVPRNVAVPVLVVAGVWATRRVMLTTSKTLLAAAEESTSNNKDKGDDAQEESDAASDKTRVEEMTEEVSSALMIGTIRFYKSYISPLLPPACRFLPTCSQYGVQAIEEFGPTKGAILTAWRLLRCSPLGGRGYDPPKWPPVFYTYGSY